MSSVSLVDIVTESFGNDYEVVNGAIFKNFDNGKVLIARGHQDDFRVWLEDPNHHLKPSCMLYRGFDDENRLSARVKLHINRIPDIGVFGQVSREVNLRSYDVVRPWWRQAEWSWDQESADGAARDKLVLNDNMYACLPRENWQGRFLRNSLKIQNNVDVEGISDAVWNPCFDFAKVAGKDMINGKFPDFSKLNVVSGLTGVTFDPTQDVLAYDGPLKDCD